MEKYGGRASVMKYQMNSLKCTEKYNNALLV